MKLGIDVIVGEPLTAKSFSNPQEQPKFYATIDTQLYNSTPTKTINLYTNTSNDLNDKYTTNLSYEINPVNKSYFKIDTYDVKQKFENTKTEIPKFDISSSYDNIKFNYQNSE